MQDKARISSLNRNFPKVSVMGRVLLLATLLVGLVGTVSAQASAVAEWRFNDASGSLKDYANGYDGTVFGSPQRQQSGVSSGSGYSYLMDNADDYIEVGQISELSASSGLTACGSGTAQSPDSGDWELYFSQYGGSGAEYFGIGIPNSKSNKAGDLVFRIDDGSTLEAVKWDIPADTPVFFCGTYQPSNNNMSLWVNNSAGVMELKDSRIYSGNDPDFGIRNLDLGQLNTGGLYWDGKMDDSSIYADTLSSSEIQQEYNSLVNSNPSIDPVSTEPQSWTLNSSINVSANVSDDGTVSSVEADVYEDGSLIVSDASLTENSGTWEIDNLFTADEKSVYYNYTLTATDNDGATSTYSDSQFIEDSAPTLSIQDPQSQNYTNKSVSWSFSASDGDDVPGETYSCELFNNGVSFKNLTGTEPLSENGTITADVHDPQSNTFRVDCQDPAGNSNSISQSYYIWRGLNISAFDSSNSNELKNWSISISNNSQNFSEVNVSNPGEWEYDQIPNGNVSIEVGDGHEDLYYFNKTFSKVVNSTEYHEFDANLDPKPENPLTLKADPSWLLDAGEEVKITGTATEGSPTLIVDGRTVANPYTATLDFGTYPVNLTIGETQNYAPNYKSNTLQVLSTGFGATSNTTFAFNKVIEPTSNPYLVDFSGLVEEDLVRPNLGDVYSSTENITLKRTGSNNQILHIDTSSYSGSKVNLSFGNYFANKSYSTVAKPSADTLNMENASYQEINPYYVLTYNLEQTGENKLPPGANVTTSLLSDSGVTSYRVNDARYLVAAREQVDEIETTVQYSATDIYQRNILPTSKVEYRTFWLVDANKNQVVELLLEKRDQTGDYSDAFVRIKKDIGGAKRAITEQYFDAEDKTVVYLINGEKYTVEVVSNDRSQKRTIGNLYVDTVDLTKTIRIQELSSLDPESGNMTYNLYQEGTNVRLDFSSPSEQSNNVTLKVWNYTNGESQNLLYENTVTDVQQANLNYDVNSSLNTTNVSVRAKGIIESEKFGNLDFAQLFNFNSSIPLAGIDLPEDTLKAAVVFLITVTPMFFNPKLARLAAAVQVLEAAFFALVLGWINIGTAVMSSGGTIAFAGILVLIESWNESPTSQARVGR